MICFLRELVKSAKDNSSTIGNVADHIIYAGNKIGYSHVGIGSDFDGMLKGPDGLDEVSQYPELISVLLEKGATEEQVKQVVGLNILRVLREVEEFSLRAKLDPTAQPSCDSIPEFWTPEEKNMLIEEARERNQRSLSQI
jgi:membrane dipeptidase